MPKPVLSDSLFNADDVAEAVLAEANLQITNNQLGVSDISSNFTLQAGFQWVNPHVLFFNGFVFFSGYFRHGGGTPASGEIFVTIDSSSYRPSNIFSCPGVGYQADSGNHIQFKTNGDIIISDPVNQGTSDFYFTINCVYHVNF